MSVSISGFTNPTDYTFTGALNEGQKSYDVTLNFIKEQDLVTIEFSVIQSNYFLIHLPEITIGRRRIRRELQSFSSTNQQLVDGAQLVQSGTLSTQLSALNYPENRVKALEDAGIYTRLVFYVFLFLFSMGLVITILATKYDGRIIGRLFDVSMFIGYLVKIPLINAGWTPYDLTYFDQLVMTDTLLMHNLVRENKVRSNLRDKFVEYSIPILIVNNSLYYAIGFILSLAVVWVLMKKRSRPAMLAKTIATVITALTLPGVYFYSGLSSMLYSLGEKVSFLQKAFNYGVGFFYFIGSLIFLLFLGFIGFIEYGKKIQKDEGSSQQADSNQNQQTTDTQRGFNIYQKIVLEGVNNKKITKIINNNNNYFTFNNLSLLRYALYLPMIIPLQEYPKTTLILTGLFQLAMVGSAIGFSFMREFSSWVVGAIVLCFEAVFLIFLSVLGLITFIEREKNSDRGFRWGTVPLVFLTLLMIFLKIAYTLTCIVLASRRRIKLTEKMNNQQQGVFTTTRNSLFAKQSFGADVQQDSDGNKVKTNTMNETFEKAGLKKMETTETQSKMFNL